MKRFEAVTAQVRIPELEEQVLAFWDRERVFEQSLERRRGGREFVFYDGPPFATGLPHYGHLLCGIIKDIVPRYQTMRGCRVERRFGWDCHGLPVEYEMETQLGISGKRQIEAYGIDRFNEACRGIVLRYTEEWEKTVRRSGRWVDFGNAYRTMDPGYMESIWWVFRQIWDQGLVYEGHKILPYCPRCATPLSNFEANLGYSEVQDPAVAVRFRIVDLPDTYALAWTTTPWTLPSNLALAVGPELPYRLVRDRQDGHQYLIAADRLPVYYHDPQEYEIVAERPGRDWAGLRYEPLFGYFAALAEPSGPMFRLLEADFVTTGEGTGIVHIAPGFGEDDFLLAQRVGLPTVCPVDEEGRFTEQVPDYTGRPVKETDRDITRRLKAEGKLVHQGTVHHSYPHCWRCDAPLIYRAIQTWFVRIEQIKDRLLQANEQIRWVPDHLKSGRFGKWLENARDWAISRNRYWGTPIPIWRNDVTGQTEVIGSIAELEARCGQRVTDLHKHFVDPLTWPGASGEGTFRRVGEVLDCWFESGAMPYAQHHYPFERGAELDRFFPADFIAEGLDQTRGWFYTLVVLGVALFDRPSFRNVVVNGLVLAEDGKKMSKRLRNYPDPEFILGEYGADALRLYMVSSPVVAGGELRFSEHGVQEVLRSILLPVWNAYTFFVTYANLDGWRPETDQADALEHPLDRWVQSSVGRLVEDVTAAMESYELQRAIAPLLSFTEELTNWYVRRSRRRFWKSDNDLDKRQAYTALYRALTGFCRVAAPFLPFLAESIYQNLRHPGAASSVHLEDFPSPAEYPRDGELERRMGLTIRAASMGRSLRTAHQLKIRQPLRALIVVTPDPGERQVLEDMQELLRDELNVKEIRFAADESSLVNLAARPSFRRLGPRLGRRVQELVAPVAALDAGSIARLQLGGAIEIATSEGPVSLGYADLDLRREERPGLVVQNSGTLTVALDTELSEELEREGLAREFVNKVQQMRKAAGLDVDQRVRVAAVTTQRGVDAVASFEPYVCAETLCRELALAVGSEGDADAAAWDLNGEPCWIRIAPVDGGSH